MIRPYRDDDYPACCGIVNQAWDFAGHLEPEGLADFAVKLYTLGSLTESSYAVVVEDSGRIAGFLFGRAGTGAKLPTPYSGVRGKSRLLWEFLTLRQVGFGQKWRWFKAISRHQVNRATLRIRVKDEVTLFAVTTAARGKGYGRKMMEGFVSHCRELGIERLVVETDTDSSYGFYDAFGFEVVGEFESPMNDLFTGSGGRSWLYVLDLTTSSA